MIFAEKFIFNLYQLSVLYWLDTSEYRLSVKNSIGPSLISILQYKIIFSVPFHSSNDFNTEYRYDFKTVNSRLNKYRGFLGVFHLKNLKIFKSY
jgi:hypothetical protein